MRCTVFLASSRVEKLPMFVIFNGSEGELGRIKKLFVNDTIPHGYSTGMFYHVQVNGCMDENSIHITFPHTLECQINRGDVLLIFWKFWAIFKI